MAIPDILGDQVQLKDYSGDILSILGPGGILAQSIAGYEYRKQQIDMAVEVSKALETGDQLIIEAPTGTGKTLSYLVAAALSRKRVAISTGTKNLQEQLFEKDVPFLTKMVFPELKTALLKGRGNFVCHPQLRRFLRQPRLQDADDGLLMRQILNWYGATRKNGQGDRSELQHLPDDNSIWPEICSSSETCLGRKCPDKDQCFVQKMRARAFDSDLMIVNHHLLASDLAVRETGFGEVIPRYEALIVDEAHGLEEAATQHFGFHVSFFKIVRFIRDSRAQMKESDIEDEKLNEALAVVEDAGRRLFSLFDGLGSPAVRIEFVDPQVAEVRNRLCSSLDSFGARLSNVPKLSEEAASLAERATEIGSELKMILSDEQTGDFACWVEHRDRGVVLHASPVEVGSLMQSRLYEKIPAVVFTSATLSSGGNFDYFRSRMGLAGQEEASGVILDSPFNYSNQTMLYIPSSMPEPNSPGFVESMSDHVVEILERTRGRAFVLFTSYRNMTAVHESVRKRLKFPLLMQGSRPRGRLLDDFRRIPGSVLLGTASFWEGVDVQGEALSCVIVDRLPFASPGDPIISSRVERIRRETGDAFYRFQVPMAVISLKQGLGRLIRTRSDRGVLCIMDVRILTKPYGRVFLKSLHSGSLSRNLQDVEEFFTVEAKSQP